MDLVRGELSSLTILPFVAALLTAAILLAFIIKSRGTFKRSRLPPSPRGELPIIGHLHLLGKKPHESLFNLAKQYGGLMFLKFGSVRTIVVSTPEYAKEVLKTHDLAFASRPALQAGTVFGPNLSSAPYGESWRRNRRICTVEIFTPKGVEALRPVRTLERDRLISRILETCKRKKTTVNLRMMLVECTFNSTTTVVMSRGMSSGKNDEKQAAKDFKQILTKVMRMVTGFAFGDFYPNLGWLDLPLMIKMRMMKARMEQYVQNVLQQHKNDWKPGQEPKDLMDVLLENGFKDDAIKSQTWDMIAAGMETTATTVEWALAELIKHPEAMQLAQQELDQIVGRERSMEEEDIPKLRYLQAVVKETLRLHPPVPLLLPHESVEACVIREYSLPAKTRVIINAYAIARDPSVWENPLQFQPQRFLCGNAASVDVKGQNYELLPFGSGRRMCPGLRLGLTMVHFLLGTLVHTFDWSPADGSRGEEIDMTEKFAVVVARKVPLILVPSPRLGC